MNERLSDAEFVTQSKLASDLISSKGLWDPHHPLINASLPIDHRPVPSGANHLVFETGRLCQKLIATMYQIRANLSSEQQAMLTLLEGDFSQPPRDFATFCRSEWAFYASGLCEGVMDLMPESDPQTAEVRELARRLAMTLEAIEHMIVQYVPALMEITIEVSGDEKDLEKLGLQLRTLAIDQIKMEQEELGEVYEYNPERSADGALKRLVPPPKSGLESVVPPKDPESYEALRELAHNLYRQLQVQLMQDIEVRPEDSSES